MILRLVGFFFRALGRIEPGDRGRDLEALGEEFGRLARTPAQRPTASR